MFFLKRFQGVVLDFLLIVDFDPIVLFFIARLKGG